MEPSSSKAENHLGYQLSAGAQMYSGADLSAACQPLEKGTIVTILDRTGEFLHIVTEDDRFGYILASVPMTRVEGRRVDSWTVQIPDLEPVSIPMTARIPAPTAPASYPDPDVAAVAPPQRREALNFLSRLQAEPDEQADRNWFAGIVAATLGMIGLLLAHALSGFTNGELAAFFVVDVLLPLSALTYNPNARIELYGGFVLLYWAALGGYVLI